MVYDQNPYLHGYRNDGCLVCSVMRRPHKSTVFEDGQHSIRRSKTLDYSKINSGPTLQFAISEIEVLRASTVVPCIPEPKGSCATVVGDDGWGSGP